MRTLSILLLLAAPVPGWACSVAHGAYGFGFGLPGLSAGPEAVFTADHANASVTGADGPVSATSKSFFVGSVEQSLIIPDAPLAPGTYAVDDCISEACEAVIAEGLGDPGVPPDAPELTVAAAQLATLQDPDCGPYVPGNKVSVEADAVAVVFAEAPFSEFEGATLVGFAFPGGAWATAYEGDVFAAAIDSEGELSEWVGPETLAHCATANSPSAAFGAAFGLGVALMRRASRVPSARAR